MKLPSNVVGSVTRIGTWLQGVWNLWTSTGPNIQLTGLTLCLIAAGYGFALLTLASGWFELLRLPTFWPAGMAAFILLFRYVGTRHHVRTGLSFHAPGPARLFVAVLAAVLGWLAWDWAVDWTFPTTVTWVVAAFVLAGPLLFSLIRYTEIWRKRWNADVCAAVRMAILGSPLRSLAPQRDWASPHRLRLMQGCYDEAKLRLLSRLIAPSTAPESSPAILESFFKAGENLAAYYRWKWPAGLLPEPERAWRAAEVRREMLVLLRWCQQHPGHVPKESRVLATAASMASGWLADFQAEAALISEAWANAIGGLLQDSPPVDPQRFIQRTLQAARALDAAPPVPVADSGSPTFLELFPRTWLALAPNSCGAGLLIDVWVNLRQRACTELFVLPAETQPEPTPLVPMHLRRVPVDPAAALAALRLHDVYRQLSSETPESFRHGFDGRAAHAAELLRSTRQRLRNQLEPADSLGTEAIHDAARITSWPYDEVWSIRQVRRLLPAGCILASAFLLTVVTLVNPGLLAPLGWNRIDFVSDPRPALDYSQDSYHGMAGSDAWLALFGDPGLTLISQYSRIPRVGVVPDPVRDVAFFPDKDEFLALGADASIQRVEPGLWPRIRPWLRAPDQPVWTSASPPPPGSINLLAAGIDDRGLVLAIAGTGVSRYDFARSGTNSLGWHGSWRLGELAELPLLQASLTHDRVWCVTDGRIRASQRSDLTPLPAFDTHEAGLPATPLHRLETPYRGHWAAAIDRQGQWWLHRGLAAWEGPFVGTPDDSPRLTSVRDVNHAFRGIARLWLGSDRGLFTYDEVRRRLTSVLPFPVTEMCRLESPDRLLVATRNGLYYVEENQGAVAHTRITPEHILSLSVSPDHGAAVFRPASGGIRYLSPPWRPSSVSVVVPSNGWSRARGTDFKVTGVEPLADRLLFTTSRGAFFYNPLEHSYLDCSEALAVRQVKPGEIERKVGIVTNFTHLNVATEGIAAVAGGKPLFWTGRHWLNLDPPGSSPVAEVVHTRGRVVGLTMDGRLRSYEARELGGPPANFVGNPQTSLDPPPPPGTRFLGDLEGDTMEELRLLFLHHDTIYTYRARDGSLAKLPMPIRPADTERIRQVRGFRNTVALVLDDGAMTVSALDGRSSNYFGRGALKFDPRWIAIVAPAYRDRLAVANRNGAVFSYDSRWGSWEELGGGPAPLDAGEWVVALQGNPDSVFLQTSRSRILAAGTHTWHAVAAGRRVASDESTSQAWILDAHGLIRVDPDPDKPPAAWTRTPFGQGRGFRDFADRSAYVWQPRNDRLVFFGRDGAVGEFRSRDDSWQVTTNTLSGAPLGIVEGTRKLFVLQTNAVDSWDENLVSTRITTLPTGDGISRAIHASPRQLDVALTTQHGVVWRRFDETGAREFRRGGAPLPWPFSPRDVVLGFPSDAGALCVTDQGACAHYNAESGVWTAVRPSASDERLHGWTGASRTLPVDLLLAVPTGTRVLRLTESGTSIIQNYPVPPASLPSHFTTEADKSEDEARLAHAQASESRRQHDALIAEREKLVDARTQLHKRLNDLQTRRTQLTNRLAATAALEIRRGWLEQTVRRLESNLALALDREASTLEEVTNRIRRLKLSPEFEFQQLTQESDKTVRTNVALRRLERTLRTNQLHEVQIAGEFLERSARRANDQSELDASLLSIASLQEQLAGLSQQITSLQQQATRLIRHAEEATQRADSLQTMARDSRALARYYAESVILPQQGEIVRHPGLRAVRNQGQTRFWLVSPGNPDWELHSATVGFAEDSPRALAFTSSGDLWILIEEHLVSLHPSSSDTSSLRPRWSVPAPGATHLEGSPSGPLRLSWPDGRSILLEGTRNSLTPLPSAAAQIPRLLVEQHVNNLRLRWSVNSDGQITAAWHGPSGPRPDLPVWSRTEDALAWQVVHDLALAQGDQLLLATELGLVVRGAFSFAINDIHPEIRPDALLTAHGPRRVLIRSRNRIDHEWSGNRLTPVTDPPTSRVLHGAWTWRFPAAQTADGPLPLHLTLNTDATSERRWIPVGSDRWAFADDRVNWCLRRSNPEDLWLATRAGLWRLDESWGREAQGVLTRDEIHRAFASNGSNDWWRSTHGPWKPIPWRDHTTNGSPPPAAEATFQHPALSISLADGRLDLTPFDGADKPVFSGGRFFFDRVDHLAAVGDVVYGLAGGRCIVGRNPNQLGTIVSCRALPSDLSLDARNFPILKNTRSDLIIRSYRQGTSERQDWFVSASNTSAKAWSRTALVDGVTPVRWEATRGSTAELRPLLYSSGSATGAPIDSWWHQDRFAWDHASGAGALGSGAVAWCTPLGISIARMSGPNEFPLAALREFRGLTDCAPARKSGRNMGLVFGSPSRTEAELVTLDDANRPGFLTTTASHLERTQLTLRLLPPDASLPVRHFGWTESWQHIDWLGWRTPPSSLIHQLPGIPVTTDILSAGAFIFDQAATLCPAAGDETHWIAATPLSLEDPARTLLTRNRLGLDSQNQLRLVLVDVATIPHSVHVIRPGQTPDLFLAWAGDSESTPLLRIDWPNAGISSQSASLNSFKDAFLSGETVTLALSGFRWRSTPRYPWSQGRLLETLLPADQMPPPVPVATFVRTDTGLAFGFDLWTSLAVAPNSSETSVVIGTESGIWMGRHNDDAIAMLADPQGSFHVIGSRPALPAASGSPRPSGPLWLTGVKRLRYDQTGRLWCALTNTQYFTRSDDGGVFTLAESNWLGLQTPPWGGTIALANDSVLIDGRMIPSTTDAPFRRRVALVFPTDLSMDRTRRTLWLHLEGRGVSKVTSP